MKGQVFLGAAAVLFSVGFLSGRGNMIVDQAYATGEDLFYCTCPVICNDGEMFEPFGAICTKSAGIPGGGIPAGGVTIPEDDCAEHDGLAIGNIVCVIGDTAPAQGND